MALINKKVMNFVYGMGAAVVIIGALFKLMHWPGATQFLIAGLSTEAHIFGLAAFDPVEEELDWSLVYPELKGGEAKPREESEGNGDSSGQLSKKIDVMLKDAKIDQALMESLANSIKNFEAAAKGIAPAVESMAYTNKYNEELSKAAAQMESLNNMYKMQLESATVNAEANKGIAENAALLKNQMQSMTENIASLNSVYGGMLSAMGNRK